MTVLARGQRPLRSGGVLAPHEIAARFRGGPGLV